MTDHPQEYIDRLHDQIEDMEQGAAQQSEPSTNAVGAKTMTEKTGPSQYAKTAGLKSLEQIARMTGASTQTLINWHRSKPELFAVVVAGCVALSNQERSGEATRQG